ncbi:MAG: hypothetical protein FD123_546 [Bacteroidetes bacterium]|nr:MAG: hypothetical protein FD123_546 [Bacteroidota bacterium]
MNKLLLFPGIFFLTFLGSCTMVYFTADQPEGSLALKEVPVTLCGTYTSETDSLIITPKGFMTVEHKEKVIAMKDTALTGISKTREGNWKFRNQDAAACYVKEVKQDSICYVKRKVLRYNLNADTLLKSYKGNYYLNMRTEKVWSVYQVSVAKKGYVAIEVPYLDKKEMEEMNKRMGAKGVDSTGYYSSVTPFRRYEKEERAFVVAASPDQLIKLNKKGLFKPVATFKKTQ